LIGFARRHLLLLMMASVHALALETAMWMLDLWRVCGQ
jgi:hypothetical protein